MSSDGPVVGIDLGGTNMQVGVVSAGAATATEPEGLVLGRTKLKTKAEEGRDAVIDRIGRAIEEACEDAGVKTGDLSAVGIGAPGAIEPKAGVVLEAVNLRWNDVPLADILEKKLGCPVVVDNDVNVAVYGENKLGAGRASDFLLGVWVGTGVGGGLILNGNLYYGSRGTAGEVGHMHALPFNMPGSRSMEHNCSRTAIVNRLSFLMNANRKSVLHELTEGRYEKIKSRLLGEAYEEKDELTVEVVNESARLLGSCIGGLVTALSLDRVVLGGGVTEALGEGYVSIVRDNTRRVAFPDALKEVDVVATALNDDAGLLGAALLAIEKAELAAGAGA